MADHTLRLLISHAVYCDSNRFKVFGPIECSEPVLSGEQWTVTDTLRSMWSPMIYGYSHSYILGPGFLPFTVVLVLDEPASEQAW